MKTIKFEPGVTLNYTTNLLGNIRHVDIVLESDENMNLVLNSQSFAATRNFLYARNANAVTFNLTFKESCTDQVSMARILGSQLGVLIKSVPTIQKVTINETEKHYTTLEALKEATPQYENDSTHPASQLQIALIDELKTSIAHPSLCMDKRIHYVYLRDNDHFLESKDTQPSNGPLYYDDQRTLGSKIYNFFATIPLLGLLVRKINKLIHGDHGFNDFERDTKYGTGESIINEAVEGLRQERRDFTFPADSTSQEGRRTVERPELREPSSHYRHPLQRSVTPQSTEYRDADATDTFRFR